MIEVVINLLLLWAALVTVTTVIFCGAVRVRDRHEHYTSPDRGSSRLPGGPTS